MKPRRSPAKAAFLLDIYEKLYTLYGECECPLVHRNPFQLLAAVMLSAQCRDERVNRVTEVLFARAADAAEMAGMDQQEIENIIRPCGLAGSKSRNLLASAEIISRQYGNQVPQSMEELTALPGIGRKSANVVLGNAFGIPGFPVDTHVNRLLNRLGFTRSSDPETIEMQVNANIQEKYWTNFSHLLIWHGRRVCHARKPECESCVLKPVCRTGRG